MQRPDSVERVKKDRFDFCEEGQQIKSSSPREISTFLKKFSLFAMALSAGASNLSILVDPIVLSQMILFFPSDISPLFQSNPLERARTIISPVE